MKVSVVVTVFNETGRHLTECLTSVLQQSLRRDAYEIILVDDCSTDPETVAIIDRFDKPASRIRVIRHKENCGPNEARRTGARAALGDYVVYVDGDDVLSRDAIEALRMQALRTNADVVIAHFYRWNDANCTYDKTEFFGRPFPQDYRLRLQIVLSVKSSFTMCGRLLRRNILSDDVFSMPLHTLHEDIICFSRIMFESRKVSSINRHIYYYRWNTNSITSRLTEAHVEGLSLAIADWVEQASRRGLSGDLSSCISEGAEALVDFAVKRIAYTASDNMNDALIVLKRLWNKVQEYPIDAVNKSDRVGVKLLRQLFDEPSRNLAPHFSELLERLELNCPPPHYDTKAMLPEGLRPSEIACRLKDKIVIICQVDYHFRNASMFAKELRRRGYPCVVIDNSAFAAGGLRQVRADDLRLLWRTEYLKIPEPPYGSDWLSAARLVVTFNDFNDDIRDALEFRNLLGQRSVCMVEGINDFLRVDFPEPRYLPYRRCDTVFLAGAHDEQYFEDRVTFIVGLPKIHELCKTKPSFPAKPNAVLNVNFTYGVLEDCREKFIGVAARAFARAGFEWVITQHPMDRANLHGLPASDRTQYELIDQGTVFVSRFATGILEALASGKPAIYFNPHGEQVAKFKDSRGAFDVATTETELIQALKKVVADIQAGVDFRSRALPFLAHHTAYSPDGPSAVERFADAVVQVVSSDHVSSRRVAQQFFERLEERDRFKKKSSGVVFGDLDRRHYAQLEETELVARYFENRGKLMVDVGANVGQSADSFLGKGWTVHAFEPDPANRKRLADLKPYYPQLRINSHAVSDKSGDTVAFYTSDESTGVSSLSAFTARHKPTCKVETITLRDYCRQEGLAHIDFLKIDVEGHDKFVLDGFDWEADKPDVVLAEFEDAKTLRNGYSAHDLAGSLLFRGYSVFVSEWLPIERYGLAHDWRRLVRYSPNLELGKSWGNLLAFLEEPDQETLRLLVEETIKFARKPEDRVSSAEAKAGVRALISDGRFRRANELFRSGSFEAALQEYLMLYDQTPFRIYEQNALWAARKLGYTTVQNAADFEMDVCGQWRPRPDVGRTGK